MQLGFLLIFVLLLLSSIKDSEQQNVFQRFLHGCPFAFPCPPPPCDNPIFGRGNCCGSCPDSKPEVTSQTPAITDITSPASLLPQQSSVDIKFVLKSRRNEMRVRKLQEALLEMMLQWESTTPPPPKTTTACPFSCTHHGYHFCHPLPCHITCVDGVKPPGACCYECPNGPNCAYNGNIIPEGQNVTIPTGETVYCYSGDIYGGSYQVFG